MCHVTILDVFGPVSVFPDFNKNDRAVESVKDEER